MSALASKRQKTTSVLDESELSFKIVFHQPGAIKQMIDITGAILGRVLFRIVSGEGNSLLLNVDTVDPHHICIVQARISCDGKLFEEGVSFCLDTKVLNMCLKNVSSQHCIELTQKKGSADVLMRTCDALTQDEVLTFVLNTYDQDAEQMPLDDIVYDFHTEVNIPELKRMIKLGCDLKVPDIGFEVRQTDKNASGECTSIVYISGKGDATFRRRLPTACKTEEGGAITTVSVIDESKLVKKYDARFTLDYLNKFVRAMEHSILTMKLGEDSPLLIEYDLGIPKSFVRFVLAPKLDESSG